LSLFLVNRSIDCPPGVILRAMAPAAFGAATLIRVGLLVSEMLPVSIDGVLRLGAIVLSGALVYDVAMLLVGRQGFRLLIDDLAMAYPSILRFRRPLGR
jgi:hypothetical protein